MTKLTDALGRNHERPGGNGGLICPCAAAVHLRLADAPRHVFYDRLNALLAGAGLWSDVPPAFKGRNSHF